MSVYTPVSESELAHWLRNYSVGELKSCEPIKAGIENSNFFVTTTQGRYVLTLFERLPAAELPFYLDLMAHLARHGIPCPAPIADLGDHYRRSSCAESMTPCREHLAHQPSGFTCTIIRRPHCSQNRGGSSPSAAAAGIASSSPGTIRLPVNGL